MTRAFRWLFPHPLLTLLLAVVWILLQNEFSAGMALFGVILGIVITKATAIWWPERPGGVHLGRLFSYAMIVLWDIIVANIQVAWIVLTKPNAALRPAWIVIPLDLTTPEAITVLAGTITLTPGTVSADLSDEGHSLLVHVLHTEDPDSDRDEIKDRYERRLKEIFL
ncbi:Na+/H+ antiporter subunit E [Sulfitobacter geojensis]|jgi:multicomponent K+:H+ antiporter subunit E|uniref:Na+/H+ antiporter subunit E n=1 Tax=Sulfitobacter geojensis TaxID=1342299 RepID=A0AAE2VZB9_9RHOB|nr:Na+/H+ antiporter subunit E [Sulfitobacter geojensis]MBM1690308.1 Na+/H+ antiporter subunit E [Sulfitobacter geojensis]MBM1694374.1 Na+/H+ antiporter subunit E [Sulfitobacter geojensis]MBM1706540.1 Na+/H+ antiporter subunit E [Sulfitobacter geojensis]MBM1710598.1 Na+/H+ antiporter subunit E [Sulfitobacter geojensis]MBM1714664.1 Na+/H+ antiporter subunit E [Sulfitobacter geojensis]